MVDLDLPVSSRDVLIAAGATAVVTAAPARAASPLDDVRRTGNVERVSFKNKNFDIAGNLHLPNGFDETRSYVALVLTTPGSSVKEQIGAVYAEKMTARGFVALAVDPPTKARVAESLAISRTPLRASRMFIASSII